MLNRFGRVFAKKTPKPANAFAPDNMVGIDPLTQVRKIGNVASNDNGRFWQVLANQFAHLAHLHCILRNLH